MGLQNNQPEANKDVVGHPYGMETIIPIEIGIPTLRTEILEEANAEAITKDLDMTDELREAIVVRIVSY